MPFRLAFAVALLWLSPTSAAVAKIQALVIGSEAYQHIEQLQRAVADARAVRDRLISRGVEPVYVENPTRLQLNAAIGRFIDRVQPGDTAFVYHSGHGVQLDRDRADTLFFLPIDLDPAIFDQGDPHYALVSEAARFSDIRRRLRERRARMRVFVLDNCRDNPLAQPGFGKNIGLDRGVGRVNAQQGEFVLFAAGPGERALDRLSNSDPNPHSVFTRVFLRHFQAGVSMFDLAKSVQAEVYQTSAQGPYRQQPHYRDGVIGKACLEGAGQCDASLLSLTDPCAGQSSIDWECRVEGGQAVWSLKQDAHDRTAAAYAAQTAVAAEGSAPTLTPEQRAEIVEAAQIKYACRTGDDEQGVLFAEKCWPLDTNRISHENLFNERHIEEIGYDSEEISLEILSTLYGNNEKLNGLFSENSRIRTIEILNELENIILSIDNLKSLAGLPNLRHIYLQNIKANDLTPLNSLSNLETLNLSGSQVSDIDFLSGFSRLQNFVFERTPVSDLTPLSQLFTLNGLWLSQTQVSDLTPLSQLTGLQAIGLSQTQVSDLTPLSGIIWLEYLDVSQTQVRDLTPLSSLTGLHYLVMPDGQEYGHQYSNTPENRAAVARAIREWRPAPQ